MVLAQFSRLDKITDLGILAQVLELLQLHAASYHADLTMGQEHSQEQAARNVSTGTSSGAPRLPVTNP